MNLLLDTHILLWWLNDDPVLKTTHRQAIAAGRNLIFVSAVSIWEIHIKAALGKLIIPANFQAVLSKEDFEPLAITLEHAHSVAQLPSYHRDPFDRMLIAQAILEGFTLITHDSEIHQYDVPTL
ncbi:MAG: type II toxin-antitoxin system VapC family toxin [Desulfobacterales bacterium]